MPFLAVSAMSSTLTVPDQAPTIQAALDAGVDTVLVEPGRYDEPPVVTEDPYAYSPEGAEAIDGNADDASHSR